MSWNQGSNAYSWYTGNGARRKDVIGPCASVLGANQRYMMRFNSIGFWGNSTGTNYVKGLWDPQAGQFQAIEYSNVETWNACWQNLGYLNDGPRLNPNVQADFIPAGQNFTSITESIDWRVALAIALLVIVMLIAIMR